jgi:hypothetical protein
MAMKTETTLIIAAVLFVLVPITGMIMVKNIVESIAFAARSEKRNRRVLEQVRRGEYPDNREYKPVDGYGYPSPTPADTAKNAVSRQTRTQNGEKVGVG